MSRPMLAVAVASLLAGCGGGAGVDPVGVPLKMVSEGIGDVVLADGYLLLDDGSRMAVQRLDEGIYALPTRQVRLPNGADLCSGRPVGFFTLHRTAEGLIAMNVGDWETIPSTPPADQLAAEGACATFTFREG
jgi:hypothetical protein